MAPINIDGTDITGATIDGTDVQEITVDGQTVFSAGPTLPNSTFRAYLPQNITASNNSTNWVWPDIIAGDNITISGKTYDNTLFNGAGGLHSDGTGLATSSTLGNYGSTILPSNHAAAVRLKSTGTERIIEARFDGGNNFYHILQSGRGADTKMGSDVRDLSTNNERSNSSTTVFDGNDHTVIMNKTGNDATDWGFYVDNVTTRENVVQVSQGASNFKNFEIDTEWFETSGEFFGALLFDDSLNQTERQQVFDALNP